MSMSGVIGKSGKFYECDITLHRATIRENIHDGPFAIVRSHFGDTSVEFYDYYTCSKTLPTQAQYDALVALCKQLNESFDNITDCWVEPWEQWRKS